MKRKGICLGIALIAALALLTGCSKEAIVDGYAKGVEWLGGLPVSLARIEGEREWGEDPYTGSYTAQYSGFTGQECLFGGTSLRAHPSVTITCALEGEEGSASLCLRSIDGEPTTLCREGSTYTGTLELPAGSNYLLLVGEDYTGSIELTVE